MNYKRQVVYCSVLLIAFRWLFSGLSDQSEELNLQRTSMNTHTDERSKRKDTLFLERQRTDIRINRENAIIA